MKVQVHTKILSQASGETLVLFAQQKKSGQKTTVQISGVSKGLKALIDAEETFKGGAKDVLFLRNANAENFKHLLFVGLGEKNDAEAIRQAAAAVFAALKKEKVKTAAIAFDTLPGKKADAVAQAVTEGLLLSAYEFKDYMTKKKEEEKGLESIELLPSARAKAPAIKTGIAAAAVLAEATNFARWLGDNPGNKMTPTDLANAAVAQAKGTKLKVTVWDKPTLVKKKAGALLGVAAGSDQDPRMIIMEYKGAAAGKKPLCLVGKGLTFDSGGISIKPGPGMEEMKFDMCGGAAVIGAMLAIARLKLKVNVVGIVPATENMPGPSATKPGDILTAMNGTTIEVNNTDAEGRLILADALCVAKEYEPAAILDAATLTGAMVIALGSSYTGVFSNNDGLMKKIEAAADAAGERVWRMPLCEDHTSDIKGTYADLCNIGSSREAGSATAAAFLKSFVDEKTPWAHFDIAGTAWNAGKRFPYHPKKGASGCMVRTFVEVAKKY